MTQTGQIRVFLVDDHEVVRRGVHELLSLEDDIETVGEAGTAAEALSRILATCPDVAVLDVRLPDGSGMEVCREIRSRLPGVKTVKNLRLQPALQARHGAPHPGGRVRGQTACRQAAVKRSELTPATPVPSAT